MTDDGMLPSKALSEYTTEMNKTSVKSYVVVYFNYFNFKQSYFSTFLILDCCTFDAELLWWNR